MAGDPTNVLIGKEIVGVAPTGAQSQERDVTTAANEREIFLRNLWRARRAALVKLLAKNRTLGTRPHPLPPQPAVAVHSGKAQHGDPGHFRQEQQDVAALALDREDRSPLAEATGLKSEE